MVTSVGAAGSMVTRAKDASVGFKATFIGSFMRRQAATLHSSLVGAQATEPIDPDTERVVVDLRAREASLASSLVVVDFGISSSTFY